MMFFSPYNLKGLSLKNRSVRSATWLGMADGDGAPGPKLIEVLARLAQNELALIVNGHSFISPEGQATPFQQGLHKDDLIPAHRRLTDAVHRCGGLVAAQLTHAGAVAREKLSGRRPVCFSRTELTPHGCALLEEDDIGRLVAQFAEAARRAQKAGYDAVQLHAAHGYLISQSLSPLFNTREDQYGGSLEGRAGFACEIIRAVRQVIGSDMPLLIKQNGSDLEPGGIEPLEAAEMALILEKNGLDGVEISGGLSSSRGRGPTPAGIGTVQGEACFLASARIFRKKLTLPIILVCGMRNLDTVEGILHEGSADLISFCRPLICEPDLILRWAQGECRSSRCISDNRCFRPGMAGKGVRCETFFGEGDS